MVTHVVVKFVIGSPQYWQEQGVQATEYINETSEYRKQLLQSAQAGKSKGMFQI